MARTSTQQVRVSADTLCRALKAAAAFCDSDKKSHRHRINLRATTWTDDFDAENPAEKSALIVAAGGPTRVIAVNAGDLTTIDDFIADISPRAAALIVKVFGQADGVDLKTDGKILTITANDALFDNHKLEVKQLQISTRADSVDIASRIHLTGLDEAADFPDAVAITAETSACVAVAAKALGASVTSEPVSINLVLGVRVKFGGIAVAWTRANQISTGVTRTWEGVLAGDVSDEWASDDITLQHLLDGALPRPGDALKAVDDVPDGGPIDLESVDPFADDSGEPGLSIVPDADVA